MCPWWSDSLSGAGGNSHRGKGLSKCGPGPAMESPAKPVRPQLRGPTGSAQSPSQNRALPPSSFREGWPVTHLVLCGIRGPITRWNMPQGLFTSDAGQGPGRREPTEPALQVLPHAPAGPGSNLHSPGEKPSGQEREAQGLVPLSELLVGSGSPHGPHPFRSA